MASALDATSELSCFNEAQAAANPAAETDWCGHWFALDEELCKEFVGIRFAKAVPEGKPLSWYFRSHTYRDGMGALCQILRQHGTQRAEALPTLREQRTPGLLAGIGAQLRFLLRKSKPAVNWKSLDPAWQTPAHTLPAGKAVATGALDVACTQRVMDKAAALGVSSNSLLLSALARASKSFLCEGDALWRVPVNMRGLVSGVSPESNHAAFIEVTVGADDTPGNVHQQIKSSFLRREHWATWFFCNVGSIVGDSGMRLIHRIYHAMTKGRPWVGTMSNLGVWDGVGDWYFGPGCQYANPIGAGVITCNGRLLLTLEAHASIARDDTLPKALMEKWIAELCA